MSGRRMLLPGRTLPARTGVASHSSSDAAYLLGVSSHSPLLELLLLCLSLSLSLSLQQRSRLSYDAKPILRLFCRAEPSV